MNAIELYEVVKDLPEEWWPAWMCNGKSFRRLRWRDSQWAIVYSDGSFDAGLTVEIAVMLFESSMMRGLLSKAIIVHTYFSHENGRTALELSGSGVNGTLHIDKPSLVEALAAACKAVAS